MSLNEVLCDGQGTALWFEARLGMLTSSRIADAVAKRKRKPEEELQCRKDLAIELAVERLTKKTSKHYVSEWMTRGTELEPLARAAYEIRTGNTVEAVDFVLHPDRENLLWAGCSPDGLVGNDLIEIKCPKPTTHLEYILNAFVPDAYIPQMTWQLACCPDAKVNTFISYCPDFPAPHDLFLSRIPRNAEAIAAMEKEAQLFLREVDSLLYMIQGGLEDALSKSLEAQNAR